VFQLLPVILFALLVIVRQLSRLVDQMEAVVFAIPVSLKGIWRRMVLVVEVVSRWFAKTAWWLTVDVRVKGVFQSCRRRVAFLSLPDIARLQ